MVRDTGERIAVRDFAATEEARIAAVLSAAAQLD
jgi:hypothetical protein